jgi:hypothetical protein
MQQGQGFEGPRPLTAAELDQVVGGKDLFGGGEEDHGHATGGGSAM